EIAKLPARSSENPLSLNCVWHKVLTPCFVEDVSYQAPSSTRYRQHPAPPAFRSRRTEPAVWLTLDDGEGDVTRHQPPVHSHQWLPQQDNNYCQTCKFDDADFEVFHDLAS